MKAWHLPSIFLGVFLGTLLGLPSGPIYADTALNKDNWSGPDGANYWDISIPGTYYLDTDGDTFSTEHSFAIKVSCSGVALDGMGKTITGSGPPTVFDEHAPNAYGIRVNAGGPSTAVQVKNFTIQEKYFGIIFEYSSSGLIEDNTTNSNNYGIYLWKGDLNVVNNNVANYNQDSGIALDADECLNSNNTFKGNEAMGNGQFGLILWWETGDSCGNPSSTITNNNFSGNGNAGIAISGNSDNCVLTGNTICDNTTNGIHIKSNANHIASNMANGNTIAGILFEHSNNNEIKGNECKGNGNSNAGIWLSGSSFNSLIENNCDSNLGHGIVLSAGSSNNILTRNRVSGNSEVGVIILSKSNENTVTEHTSNANSNGLKLIDSIKNDLNSNTINDNLNSGVLLESSANENIIARNQISGNITSGIWVASSSYNSITNNTCDNNIGHGILLCSASNNNVLMDNGASGNTEIGIIVLSSSNSNLIATNAANQNAIGMRLDSSSENEIRGNTLQDNLTGGMLLESASNENKVLENEIKGSQNAGIWLNLSNTNTIFTNRISEHKYWGIFLVNSSDQIIYNNYFNNPSGNAGSSGTCQNNLWSISKTSGQNIMGGPYLGGNFWGKPDGQGFSQITPDTNGDGFCDSAYTIFAGNLDQLPLHEYAQPTDIFVNPNDPTCGDNYPCFASIQDAINASSSGKTIKLVQGTYTAVYGLTENKAFTIQGGWDAAFQVQTPGTTFIQPPGYISSGSLRFLDVKMGGGS